MSKKSGVAMTGLCVLMATSAAQAHPIASSVEDFEVAAQVSRSDATRRSQSAWDWALEGAGKRRELAPAQTFSRALGQQSSVAELISRVPLRTSDQAHGRNGDSIVDRICDPLPPATKVPEPETLALLMAGLLGVAVTGRRRRRSAATG